MSAPRDTSYTDLPVCPNCGYAHHDSWEWHGGGDEDGEHDCDHCGKEFRWTRHVSVNWTTHRTEAKP